eukprot:5591214-Prymnesium_polylepis.1
MPPRQTRPGGDGRGGGGSGSSGSRGARRCRRSFQPRSRRNGIGTSALFFVVERVRRQARAERVRRQARAERVRRPGKSRSPRVRAEGKPEVDHSRVSRTREAHGSKNLVGREAKAHTAWDASARLLTTAPSRCTS